MVMNKSTSGRRKIPIVKIEKKSNLQVTFSKRRTGLFKKASELCILCGVEIAIIVFSPVGKAFSFGNPEVESILERYINGNIAPLKYSSCSHQILEARRNANVQDLNMKLTQILNWLEFEKKKGEELDQVSKTRREFWWENPIDELGSYELQQLKAAMQELKRNIANQVDKITVEKTTNAAPASVGTSNCEDNEEFGSKLDMITAPAVSNVHNMYGYLQNLLLNVLFQFPCFCCTAHLEV